MFPHESKCYRRLVFDEEEEYLDYIEEQSTLLEDFPSSIVALNNRGVAYYEFGCIDKAISDLRLACDLAKESTPFLNLAEVIASQGHIDEAVRFASKAIQISPEDSCAYAVRAEFYKKMGNLEAAQNDLSDARRFA